MITEKALKDAGIYDVDKNSEQVLVFRVDPKSTKDQIKRVVENIYDVKVKSVNTLNQSGKVKFFKQRKGKRSDFKKAYVMLEKGSRIELDLFKKEGENAQV
ncbi:MAG: 50S ribosomal protein L23 [Alphaproteobacteria bacterium]|nr:MAG: 50S ribosomal protein L23 [Alphaproteobacteria bacterium]